MSLDYLQVRGSRTSVKSPGAEISTTNSIRANTGIEIGRGMDVTDTGMVQLETFPTDSAPSAIRNSSCMVVGNGDTLSYVAGVMRVSASAARTGLLMPAGTRSGQIAYVINCANASLTFATHATSKVVASNPTTAVIGAWSAAALVWDNAGASGWMVPGWHLLG